jgi:diadenosine tetraphosphate (Ap4A) HIT family hydrolase
MQSGWAVMGDPQVLRGYCLLLPDPVVPHLNALPPEGQALFMRELAALGQAVFEVVRPVRINFALFGNVEPALHGHVIPRYEDEPESLRKAHPWSHDWSAAPPFDPVRDGPLLATLRARLEPQSNPLSE